MYGSINTGTSGGSSSDSDDSGGSYSTTSWGSVGNNTSDPTLDDYDSGSSSSSEDSDDSTSSSGGSSDDSSSESSSGDDGQTAMEQWQENNPDVRLVNDSSDQYDTTPGDDPTDVGETNNYDLQQDATQPSEDNDGSSDIVVTDDPANTVPINSDESGTTTGESNPEVTLTGDSESEIEADAQALANEMQEWLPEDPDDWLGSGTSDQQIAQALDQTLSDLPDVQARLGQSFEAVPQLVPGWQSDSGQSDESPALALGMLALLGITGIAVHRRGES